MPRISIQKPTDQPSGRVRMLDEIRNNLCRDDLDEFKLEFSIDINSLRT